MGREIAGRLRGKGLRIAVVASQFNHAITDRLLDGAKTALTKYGLEEGDTTVVWVPGAFEIPLLAQKLADTQRFDAIICLGSVIKKETAHFEHVATQCAAGIAAIARESRIPVIFGVLTTYTIEQAEERSGGEQGDRGYDAALAAIQMANLLQNLEVPE